MGPQTAVKHFNLDEHLLGEFPDRTKDPAKKSVASLPLSWDTILLFTIWLILILSEDNYSYQPASYPFIYPLILGGILIISGIAAIKILDLTDEMRIRPISLMIIGAILLVYMPVYYLAFPFFAFWKLLAICFAVRYIPAPILWARSRKKRCTLPTTAVCIGVLHEEVYRSGISPRSWSVFHPVWEYKIPVRGNVLNEQSVIPVMDNGDVMKAFRGSMEPWSESGTPSYGDTREILVNPKDPTEVFYYEPLAIPAAILSVFAVIIMLILFLSV